MRQELQMSAKQIVEDIFATLRELPMDKLVEVRDFAAFLKERDIEKASILKDYAWTEEELRDLSIAVWDYGNESAPWEE
jgi:hypothetical protein